MTFSGCTACGRFTFRRLCADCRRQAVDAQDVREAVEGIRLYYAPKPEWLGVRAKGRA